MKTAIVTSNPMTAIRASVIAQRTNDGNKGIITSLMIDDLKEKLSNGIAHFWFRKCNGEIREMFATTNKTLVEKHVVGTGVSREFYGTSAVFDVEKGAWRSFRWENLLYVA